MVILRKLLYIGSPTQQYMELPPLDRETVCVIIVVLMIITRIITTYQYSATIECPKSSQPHKPYPT